MYKTQYIHEVGGIAKFLNENNISKENIVLIAKNEPNYGDSYWVVIYIK